MKPVPSSPTTAVLVGDFDGFTPLDLFEFWTEPDKLRRWWPEQATLELNVGGPYHFSWPDAHWDLRGQYTAVDPGIHLGFTWKWDHETDSGPAQQVDLWLEALEGGGSRLAIFQGAFEDSERGRTDRQSVIEGWIHFGMRLAGLRVGDAD